MYDGSAQLNLAGVDSVLHDLRGISSCSWDLLILSDVKGFIRSKPTYSRYRMQTYSSVYLAHKGSAPAPRLRKGVDGGPCRRDLTMQVQ